MFFSQAYLNKIRAKTETPSYLISLKPDQDTASRLIKLQKQFNLTAKDEATESNQFHITLRYWRYEDFDDKNLDDVIQCLEKEDFFTEPILIKNRCKFETLGKDKALVLLLDAPELKKCQGEMDKAIQEFGVPPSDYSSFKAHLTLAYPKDTPEDLPEGINIPMKFSIFEFKNYKDKVYIKKELK